MMTPTPTKNKLPHRKGSFNTLAEALDYAAEGDTGFNFYNGYRTHHPVRLTCG